MNPIFIAFFVLIAFLFHQFYWRRRGLPPGPFCLPLIGNLHQFLGTCVEEKLLEWRKQYGDLYTIWQGRNPIIVVGDYQLCLDLFVKEGDTFAGRGVEHDFMKAIRGSSGGGILLSEGERWREQRRFALHVFRNFGIGKNLMQEKILEEVQTLHERIDEQSRANGEVAINDLVDASIGSIINCMLFGYRYTDEQKLAEFWDLQERTHRFMHISGDPVVLTIRSSGCVHYLKHLPLFKEKYAKAHRDSNYLLDFFRERIANYKESGRGDLDTEPTDFLSAFLQEQHKKRLGSEIHYFTDENLLTVLFDLWIAGQDTTSNTLGWGIAHLVHNPRVQEKIHKELDMVIGGDRLVTVSDKPALPYLSAVINEIQRIANLLPMNVLHKTLKDTRIREYEIKQGTWIVPQLTLILYDPNIFDDPRTFRPERFLDDEGKLKQINALLPFSLGKRQCLGESLARMELFLFLANLMNRYKILPACELPSLERRNGLTIRPVDYKVRVEPRY